MDPTDPAVVLPHVGHYTKKCRECGVVMDQCRCADAGKQTLFGICGACAAKRPKA